jgi:hypothetical protein
MPADRGWIGKGNEVIKCCFQIAGQSHEAMFERGPDRGNGAAKEKCAAKMELMTVRDLAVGAKFLGRHGFGLGSSVGRARPW